MSTIRPFGILILASSFLMSAGPGRAEEPSDLKRYPGSTCVKWSSTGTVKYSYSGIGNSASSGTLRVDCPLLKDGAEVSAGWFHALDRNSSASITCNMYAVSTFDGDGSVYVESTEAFHEMSTSGAADQHQFLLWNTAAWFFHGPTKHYYMGCSIPPTQNGNTSYLQTYGIMED